MRSPEWLPLDEFEQFEPHHEELPVFLSNKLVRDHPIDSQPGHRNLGRISPRRFPRGRYSQKVHLRSHFAQNGH